MITEALRTWLIAQPAVTAIIGTRAYPAQAPQRAALPMIVFTRESEDKHPALDGTGGHGDLASAEFDLECIALTAAVAGTLAAAVAEAIKDYSGEMGEHTCEAVMIRDEYDGYQKPTDGSDNGRHVTTIEFQLQYR